jgi:hypothetical protein
MVKMLCTRCKNEITLDEARTWVFGNVEYVLCKACKDNLKACEEPEEEDMMGYSPNYNENAPESTNVPDNTQGSCNCCSCSTGQSDEPEEEE